MVRRVSKMFKLEPERTAAQANLEYVTDRVAGIRRVKAGTHFHYTWNSVAVTSAKTLERIRKLAIPPAWTEVWICNSERGHLQATGLDVRGRKQYRYHPLWNDARNQTKFHGLMEFGRALPDLRRKVIADLSLPGLSRDKVLATVVSLMERTFIRIGNSEYEKLYGSYGLTTLKDGHVEIKGPVIRFAFRGKKGISHSITLRNRKLANIVKACRDIPGKELFQYYNDTGEHCSIDSGMVNNYIRQATGRELTAKDFRTWAGTLSILNSFRELDPPSDLASTRRNVNLALDEVCLKLGNTRTVCRKYYVHPQIVKLYEEGGLTRYLNQMEGDSPAVEMSAQLTADEKVLMRILQKLQHL